jgi:hypothetical protein
LLDILLIGGTATGFTARKIAYAVPLRELGNGVRVASNILQTEWAKRQLDKTVIVGSQHRQIGQLPIHPMAMTCRLAVSPECVDVAVYDDGYKFSFLQLIVDVHLTLRSFFQLDRPRRHGIADAEHRATY